MKLWSQSHTIALITFFYSLTVCYGASGQCDFVTHNKANADLQKRLQPILGKTYKVEDTDYSYDIGICTDVDPTKEELGSSVAVVQHEKANGKKTFVIGRYNNTQIMEGAEWLILEYLDGDNYKSHCGSEKRKARLMITCNRDVKLGNEEVKIAAEEKEKSGDCFYLFEMESSIVCVKDPIVTVSLSVGSIFIIVFIVVVFLYISLGFLYNRVVLGAKGKEQIPNYSFWQDFGNLQADGCNFVCRSGNKTESKQYKGLGDDQLQESEDPDDNLLPM